MADPEAALAAMLPVPPGEVAALLRAAGGSVERAVALYFDGPGAQRPAPPAPAAAAPAAAPSPRPAKRRRGGKPASSRQPTISSFFTGAAQPPRSPAPPRPPLVVETLSDSSGTAPSPTPPVAPPPRQQQQQQAPDSAAIPPPERLHDCTAYAPVRDALWTPPAAAPFEHLTIFLRAMELTKSRLRIRDLLTNMFRTLLALSPDSVLPALYISLGRLAPTFAGVELGVGGSTVYNVVATVTGKSPAYFKRMYEEKGDLGDIAQDARAAVRTFARPRPLTINHVFDRFRHIAAQSGPGSAKVRSQTITQLLVSATGSSETRFIVRFLTQAMRIGASERSILDGLARAVVIHADQERHGTMGPLSAAHIKALAPRVDALQMALRTAYFLAPNLEVIVPAMLERGIEGLGAINVSPGTPLKPMLALPGRSLTQVWEQYTFPFFADYKYDGQRAQIHRLSDGSFKLFSRNNTDITAQFPDVIEYAGLALAIGDEAAGAGTAVSFVVDAEIVPVDPNDPDRLLPFQVLSTRSRNKYGRPMNSGGGPQATVRVFLFDIMYLNETPFLSMPFSQRRALLEEAFRPVPDRCTLATGAEIASQDGLEQLFEASVRAGCEGVMVKALESTYDAGKRSASWTKVKKDFIEGCGDTFDLVVIGGWMGNGRKAGFVSPYLLAAFEPNDDDDDDDESGGGRFFAVTKVMSGFSDEFYREWTFGETRVPRAEADTGRLVLGGSRPTWLFPIVEVWEIACGDLSLSPVYPAGACDATDGRGISLRFPRFVRRRPDKRPQDATRGRDLLAAYRRQVKTGGKGPPGVGPLDGSQDSE